MDKSVFMDENIICFTSDLDWAPEVAIRMTLDYFKKNEIKPSVFITHKSKVIEERKGELDLGIHPNFIQPSSQGKDRMEVIDYCQQLLPDAVFFRSHRWYADNDIYDELYKRGFRYESNLCTNMDVIPPFIHRSGMISFPVFFEDGAYIFHDGKLEYSCIKDKICKPGLKIINIHPMHFALNTPYFKYTREIKDRLSREEWNGMSEITLSKLSYEGNGIRNLIIDLIADVKDKDIRVMTLSEIYELWKKNEN